MTLEDYRKNRDMSYSELGKELGVSKSRAYRICKMRVRRDFSKLRLGEINAIFSKTEGRVSAEDIGLDLGSGSVEAN